MTTDPKRSQPDEPEPPDYFYEEMTINGELIEVGAQVWIDGNDLYVDGAMTELLERGEGLRAEHGTNWDAALVDLRELGATIVQSAIVTAQTLGVTMDMAKRIVHHSPAWADRRETAEYLHAQADEQFSALS